MKNWPFALWGGDGSDDEGDNDEGSDEPDPSITMTQKEFESSIAKAASRAARKAAKELRTSLGFDKQEDLTSFVEGTREAAESAKTEEEQRLSVFEQERKALLVQTTFVQTETRQLAADRVIVKAGVTDEAKQERIRTLVLSELGNEVDLETIHEDVQDALDSVRNDVPELFSISKKRGSGDGGATDHEPETDEEKYVAKKERYRKEYAAKGMIFTESPQP